MKKLFALLALSAISTLSYATPSDTSVKQLLEVTPYEAVFYENIIAPISEEREMLAYNLMSDETLSDDQRKKAIEAFDSYAENLIKTLDTPAIKTELKTAYGNAIKAHYTQAEVDAQIAFYGSEAGKSALEKSSLVLNDYLKTVAPTGLAKIESYQQTNLIKMQDNIKRILNK